MPCGFVIRRIVFHVRSYKEFVTEVFVFYSYSSACLATTIAELDAFEMLSAFLVIQLYLITFLLYNFTLSYSLLRMFIKFFTVFYAYIPNPIHLRVPCLWKI